jgi:transposase
MSHLWGGIDLGEDSAHLCVIDDDGAVVLEEICSSDALAIHEALAVGPGELELLGVEAGIGTHQARMLRALGHKVGVFEARTVRHFLEAFLHKTDGCDARGIAEIARHGGTIVPRVYVKSPECQQLRSELTLRSKMLQQRVTVQAVIRSLFRLHAGRTVAARRGVTLRQAAGEELARLVTDGGVDLADQVEPLLDIYESLALYCTRTDARLGVLARKHPVCSRLMTIPGVGFLTALSFYSAIEDPARFTRGDSVGAYLGLVPRIHQSGTMKRRMSISKRGSKLTRTHLAMAAQSLLRPAVRETALKRWGLGLAERIGMRRARIAVARKLAVIMLAVWKSGQPYEPFPAPRTASCSADTG